MSQRSFDLPTIYVILSPDILIAKECCSVKANSSHKYLCVTTVNKAVKKEQLCSNG